MKRGMLVTFEGGDGCGKSTQIKRFQQFLEEQKIDYILRREPGGTDLGEKIRQLLLHEKTEMSAETEFLLFSASRAKLVEDVIKPALNEGKVVVLDRFYLSSYAYQGFAGDLDLNDVKEITNFAIKGCRPDLTILLDLDYDVALSRKANDKSLEPLDRIESKGKAYHNKVRKGYLTLAKEDPKTIFVVDASKSPDEIFEKIKEKFLQEYSKK